MIKTNTYFLAILLMTGLCGCKMMKIVKTIQSATLNQKQFNIAMPFDYPVSHILLHIGVNGSPQKYEFIFDSGAGITVISQTLADNLGLKTVNTIPVKDGQGTTVQKKLVIIPELDLNGLKFYNVGAVVSDFGPNSAINCLGKDGIIGVNVISKCNWTVDFPLQTLTATDTALNFPKDAISIPFYFNIPHINVNVNGTLVKGVFVDLGSNESFTLQQSVLTSNPGLFPGNAMCRQTGYSAEGFNGAGLNTIWYTNHDSLNINGQNFYPVQTTIMNSPMNRIGNKFWEQYLMGIDYKSHEILLSRNKSPVADTTLKGMGFAMSKTDSGYVISAVFDNSPATDKGLKINDLVTEIDGRPMAQKFSSYCQFIMWVKTNLPELQTITIKIKGRNDLIVLNKDNYRPVKR